MMPRSIPSERRQIATHRATGTRTSRRASASASSKSPASARAPSLVAIRQGVASAITSAPPRVAVQVAALELRRLQTTSSPKPPRPRSIVRLPLAKQPRVRASPRAKTTRAPASRLAFLLAKLGVFRSLATTPQAQRRLGLRSLPSCYATAIVTAVHLLSCPANLLGLRSVLLRQTAATQPRKSS
jgi:hypothetical protein